MAANPAPQAETLIERIIGASSRNAFLVLILTLFGIAGGIYALTQIPLDAIPDESDVQVIVYTDWEGRSPDLVEDQITYPISTKFIAAPKVKFVRKVVRVRNFPGWDGHILGAFPRDRIPELSPGFAP